MIRAVIFDCFGVLYLTHSGRNEKLLTFISQMRSDVKIGLLSNIGSGAIETIFPKAERTKIFDASVLSGEVGMVKPYPEIYLLTAERLEVEASECLFIDDSEDNCAGACEAGMKSLLFRSTHQAVSDMKRLLY